MGLSFLMLFSVFLMTVNGQNQARSEPGRYWDKVLPNTFMPSAIEKLLPKKVAMKPSDSGNIADGRVHVGRKGGGDNSGSDSNGDKTSRNAVEGGVNFVEGRKVNDPPLWYWIPPIVKSDASINAVGDGVNFIKGKKLNNDPPQFWFWLPPIVKSDASINDVDDGVNFIEDRKFNDPPYWYWIPSIMKSDASRNVAEGGVNFIEGRKLNDPPYWYWIPPIMKSDASKNIAEGGVNFIEGKKLNDPPYWYWIPPIMKSDASRNAAEEGVNFIEGKKLNDPPYWYWIPTIMKSDASRNVADGGVNFIEGTKFNNLLNTDMNFDPSGSFFFHRKELLPDKRFTLLLGDGVGRYATFIPRQEANAIPFMTSELPSILSRYSIPPGSSVEAAMRHTLQLCEWLPVAGEVSQCVTSLEEMVDFATMRLGTHDVVAMAMEGGDVYAVKRRPYKVKAIRRVVVAGDKKVVACHPQPYPYAVFFCHSTNNTEVYSIDLIVEDDGAATIKSVAVCHMDTSKWDVKHISSVKAGKGVLCHFLPLGSVVWVTKL